MRFLALLACTLAACAPLQPMTPPDPIVHTIVQTVQVPVPIPCFREDERPRYPEPTPIDIEHSTIEQRAAAEAADAKALEIFARAVDLLFLKCQEATKRVIPTTTQGKP